MKIPFEVGAEIALVFRTAPFTMAVNPTTGHPETGLQTFSGIFLGYPAGETSSTFRLQQDAPGVGAVYWMIDDREVLLVGELGRVAAAHHGQLI